MTQPRLPQDPGDAVWDGRGVDPWLPQRLAHNQIITAGERTLYDSYYARLARWLVEAERAVTAGVVPDPDAVWSKMPDWVRLVTQFVRGPVADLLGATYRALFGAGYRFDQRPFVAKYLAEAESRLVDVPNQVYSLVVGQIAEGAGMGESISKIRDRVQQAFNTTDTPYWANRAVVVARTETLGAFNAGRQDSFVAIAEELDEPLEQGWLATHGDGRTRPTHMAADIGTPITGQRVPLGQPFIVGGFALMRPGDPAAPAKETAQCRCTTILLRPGEDVDLSDRQMLDF